MAVKKIVKKNLKITSNDGLPADRLFPDNISSGFMAISSTVKKTHWISTTVQYIILATFAFLFFRGCNYHLQFPVLTMKWYMVVPVGLSLAYVWVDVFHWGVVKPFTCIACMTGWLSLIIAFAFHVPLWYFYASLGTFAGAVYSSVRMRYF